MRKMTFKPNFVLPGNNLGSAPRSERRLPL
jgi:hypothetical protein